MVTVTTKDELTKAKDEGAAEIVVVGELADKLKRTKKIATLGAASIAALAGLAAVATIAAPETAGLSYAVALGPAVALTGMEIGAIVIAVAIGITLIVAVFKDYEEINYEDGKLTLRKKAKA